MTSQPEDSKPAPVVADVGKCAAAVDAFVDGCLGGVENPAQAYRNIAHATALLKKRVATIRAAFRRDRHAAVNAAKEE